MTTNTVNQNSLLVDVWKSFRSLPGQVQFWVALVLMPVNIASLLYISEPMGAWIAFLANVGMLLNLPVLIAERGFSRLLSVPHLLPWTTLVALILFFRPDASGSYADYLSVVLVVNIVSLVFDYRDAWHWLKGDRAVAGHR